MSTQRRNSAVFAEVSGPHKYSYYPPPWNEPYHTGLWGLGAYENPVPGGNYSDYTGLVQSPGWHLQRGQVGRFILVAQGGRLASREALEAELESRGIWTRALWIQQGGQQATWIVGPRDRTMTSDEILAQIVATVGKTSGVRVMSYMPAPPEWANYFTLKQGNMEGLGATATCAENAACANAAQCPPGTSWIATRSVPEGGMCVTPEAYANFTGATVAGAMGRPWRGRYVPPASFWEENKTLILVGGGLVAMVGITTAVVLLTKKGKTKPNRRARNARRRNVRGGLYHIPRLTKTEYATLQWLADRGYDAGILKAAGVADDDFPDGGVLLESIPEWKAWEISDAYNQDPHAFLTSSGSRSLNEKLRRFLNSIV